MNFLRFVECGGRLARARGMAYKGRVPAFRPRRVPVLNVCRFLSLLLLVASPCLAADDSAASLFSAEGLSAFFNTKWGQYTLILVFFSLIIGYLRVLFGPRGMFREKRWDEMNEEFRRKEAEEQAARDAARTAAGAVGNSGAGGRKA